MNSFTPHHQARTIAPRTTHHLSLDMHPPQHAPTPIPNWLTNIYHPCTSTSPLSSSPTNSTPDPVPSLLPAFDNFVMEPQPVTLPCSAACRCPRCTPRASTAPRDAPMPNAAPYAAATPAEGLAVATSAGAGASVTTQTCSDLEQRQKHWDTVLGRDSGSVPLRVRRKDWKATGLRYHCKVVGCTQMFRHRSSRSRHQKKVHASEGL